MLKKKIAVLWLSFSMVALSSVSVYAISEQNQSDENNATNAATEKTEDDSSLAEGVTLSFSIVKEASMEQANKKVKEKKAQDAAEERAAKEREAERKAGTSKTGLAAYIRMVNPNVGASQSLNMASSFISIGNTYGVDPLVLMGIAKNESTYYANAHNSAGYRGLMQTSAGWANKYGYSASDLFTPSVSIEVGARCLKSSLDKFGDYKTAISGYAYGEGAAASGNFSYAYANSVMNNRASILSFLKSNGYV